MSAASLRLMRAGLVPSESLDLLTIGRPALDQEAERGLQATAAGNAGEPLFVNGEWGTGKTHSLQYIRSVTEKRGHAATTIVLDARTRAPTHPQRLHPVLARDMRLEGRTGLRSILPPMLENTVLARRVASSTTDRNLADVADGLYRLTYLIEARETARIGVHEGWRSLLGTDIAWSDYAYRREKALERIAWTARILTGLGAGGLVVFLDELETIDQLWNNRSRAVAYETFGRLSAMPHVWCVFGVTERFLRVVYDDARSQVYLNARPAAQEFLRRFRYGEARMIAPPAIGRADARRLAGRVSKLYHRTYGAWPVPDHDELLKSWLGGTSLNPRRLVRAIVDAHDRARPLPGLEAAAAA
jgi:bacteriophage exclusion system BrxC/D-like protein